MSREAFEKQNFPDFVYDLPFDWGSLRISRGITDHGIFAINVPPENVGEELINPSFAFGVSIVTEHELEAAKAYKKTTDLELEVIVTISDQDIDKMRDIAIEVSEATDQPTIDDNMTYEQAKRQKGLNEFLLTQTLSQASIGLGQEITRRAYHRAKPNLQIASVVGVSSANAALLAINEAPKLMDRLIAIGTPTAIALSAMGLVIKNIRLSPRKAGDLSGITYQLMHALHRDMYAMLSPDFANDNLQDLFNLPPNQSEDD